MEHHYRKHPSDRYRTIPVLPHALAGFRARVRECAGGDSLVLPVLDAVLSLIVSPGHAELILCVRGLLRLRRAAPTLFNAPQPLRFRSASRSIVPLFTALATLDSVHPSYGLSQDPTLEDSPLAYFLWQATLPSRRSRSPNPAAKCLLVPCLRALRKALEEWPRQAGADRPSVVRLPFQLATFIRYFPAQLDPASPALASVTVEHVRTSFEAYRRDPKGISSEDTLEQYVANVSRSLGFGKPPRSRRPGRISEYTWPRLRNLRPQFSPSAEVPVVGVPVGEDDGARRGMLALPEITEDDAHPLEEAIWVQPDLGLGNWTRLVARSEWYPQLWDGRGLSPNEVARAFLAVTRGQHDQDEARVAVLYGVLLWTGLPAKRIEHAKIWRGSPEAMEEWVREHEEDIAHDPADYVVVCPAHGIYWAKVLSDPFEANAEKPRSRISILRAPLPAFLKPLTTLSGPSVSPSKSLTPQFLGRGGGPLGSEVIRALLWHFDRKHRICKLKPAISPSRVRHTLRTHISASGRSTLIPALLAGTSGYQDQVALHYVNYPSDRFWERAAAAQQALTQTAVEILRREGETVPEPEPPPPPPAFLPEGHYGAKFTVESRQVAVALRMLPHLRRAARTPGRRLNLRTLEAVTILMAGTGIREMELPGIQRKHFDPGASILRIRRKTNGYFSSSGEIPLNAAVVECLTNYVRYTARLGTSSAGDAFFWRDLGHHPRPLQAEDLNEMIEMEGLQDVLPFRPRHLRHWLRTELEWAGTPSDCVNDPFGHSMAMTTVLHRLGSINLREVHDRFRRDTARILSTILP